MATRSAQPGGGRWSPMVQWLIAVSLLAVAFAQPLYAVVRLSLADSLYSHLPLIPLVSGFLLWRRYGATAAAPSRSAVPAVVLAVLGTACVVGGLAWASPDNSLPVRIAGMLVLITASAFWFMGQGFVRQHAFAFGFLVFMVPFPKGAEAAIETVLQHGSATMAHGFFQLSSTPVFREDLLFHLPGISLQVAPECSGIRSSLALLITSVVAGYIYLRSPWKRSVLALAVFPLALVRNGFRVFVIGELCVRVGPEMIHSYIHRHGGPIFFALSLVPFGLLLYALRRSERRASQPVVTST